MSETVENKEKIVNMIQAVGGKKFSDANNIFSELVNDKIRDALEMRKVSLASEVFGSSDKTE